MQIGKLYNGKINQIVYRGRGFRNIYNMIDSVLFFYTVLNILNKQIKHII